MKTAPEYPWGGCLLRLNASGDNRPGAQGKLTLRARLHIPVSFRAVPERHDSMIRGTHRRRNAIFAHLLPGQSHMVGAHPRSPVGSARRDTRIAPREWVAILDRYPSLSWEMLPDAALGEADVWSKLIGNGMPQTALMRQLPRLTRLGLLAPMSDTLDVVVRRLTDRDRLVKARVHPVNVLVAARTYASGASARGQSSWEPVSRVVDALDAAFYTAFASVQPANMRTLLALDVSGSMTAPVSGLPVTAREVSAALALVTAAIEPKTSTVGFTASSAAARSGLLRRGTGVDGIAPLSISPRQRLDDVLKSISGMPFSRTDCALPMLWATANKVKVDTFVIYTDNETWAGSVHPHQALRQYRDWSGIDARLVVAGLTATDFTIPDPADPGMLDIAGFDSALPTLLNDFSARAI